MTLLGNPYRFFRSKKTKTDTEPNNEIDLMTHKNNIDYSLRSKDYETFKQHFSLLLRQAENCPNALLLVNDIHSQMSAGASERILPKEIELRHIQVSETMFNLYSSRQAEFEP